MSQEVSEVITTREGAIKAILTFLAEKRKVTITDEELESLNLSDEVEEQLISDGILVRMEPRDVYCENCTNILAPFEFDKADYALFAFLTTAAAESDELGCVYDKMDLLIARWLYERHAGGFEFIADEGEDPYAAIAWFILQAAEKFNIEFDEVVDHYDYKRYTGPRFYRLGSAWLMEDWEYCNNNRWGTCSGVFKCATYAFRAPSQ